MHVVYHIILVQLAIDICHMIPTNTYIYIYRSLAWVANVINNGIIESITRVFFWSGLLAELRIPYFASDYLYETINTYITSAKIL